MAIDKAKLLKSAEKFIASGKIANAIDEYLKILKENPKDWNLMIQIGDLYLKINKTADAIQHFQKVADHYYTDGFFLKAIAIYKRINKLDPNLTEICMRLADLYLKQGLTMDAKSQLQVVAQHYLTKNQTKDAIQTLKKLIEIEPDNLKSRNDLARAYKNEGMIVEAIKEYLEISDELTRKNMLKESLAVLETAFKLDPSNTAILRKILSIYAEQNDMARAMSLLEDALKTDPSNSQVLALLAETYANKNQFKKAHDTIDQAIVNTADKEPFWMLKGDLFLKEGNLQKAYSQYELVIERQMRRKELDHAVNLLQKVTRADPSFTPALQKLVELYTALKQETQLLTAYHGLIDAYISKAMYQEASEYLEKLINVEPDNVQHQEKLEFVRSFLEKPKPRVEPKKPAPIPVEVSPEVPEEVSSDDFELNVNLDIGMPTIAPVHPSSRPSTQPPPPSIPMPMSSKPLSAVAVESGEEEKEFASEHLIEAEVFSKYGLIDKAIEQLQIIIAKYPNSVLAHQKLKEIYLEKGERDKAVEECVTMSVIFRKQGDLDQAEDLLSEARQIQPNHPALDRAYRDAAAPAKIAPADTRKPAPPPKPAAPVPEAAPPSKTVKDKVTVTGRMRELEELARPKAAPKPAPPKPAAPPSMPAELEIEVEEPSEEAPGLAASDFEEIDFYTSQGLTSEAKRLLEELRQKYPDDPSVLLRLRKLGVAVEPPPAPVEEELPVEVEADQASAFDLLASAETPEESIDIEIPVEEAPAVAEFTFPAVEEAPAESAEDSLFVSEPAEVELEEPAPEVAGMEELPAPELEEAPMISIDIEEPAETPEEIPMSVDFSDYSTETVSPPDELPAVEQTMDIGDISLLPTPKELEQAAPEELSIPVEAEEVPAEVAVSVEMPEEAPLEISLEMPEEPQEVKEEEAPPAVDFGELEEPVVEMETAPEPLPPAEPPVIETAVSQPPTPEPQAAPEVEFPKELSLDDALDAAFTGEEEPEQTAPVKASQELFEEEEDFFDLAAELEEGFLNVQSAVEEDRPADGQNYSIEEILTDFKKGVEKQLGAEDYDTRYNLGIAYKEMGLIDEAIAEFQIASKDEKRFLECCSMLGLCFLEKGMPKLALKWYQRGLETKGYNEEEYLGLRFEMAKAYEATGEVDKALEFYQEVYGANAGYRNVSKKIKDLQEQAKIK